MVKFLSFNCSWIQVTNATSLSLKNTISGVLISRHFLGLGLDTPIVPLASVCRFLMSYIWTISSLTSIPFHLPTDGRFMDSYCFSYLRLVVVPFQKDMNLISLTLGELVVAHKRSFDLPGLYWFILHQLTSFNLQSCAYELNLALYIRDFYK